MGVKRKEIEILLNIVDTPLTVRELSEKLGDSERNLRYSVENLDYYLKRYTGMEIMKKNKKLSVSLTREEADGFLCSLEDGEYIYSNEERREHIMNTFLFSEEPKLSYLERELDVSRTTIKKDMSELQKELERYGLSFEHEGNRVFIGGNEKKLRHLMMVKMMKYLDRSESSPYPLEKRIVRLIEGRRRGLQKRAQEVLERIEGELQEEFSAEFKRIMRYYLWATLFRVGEGRYILRKHNSEFLRKTSQFTEIEKVMKEYIGEGLEYETLHLTEYFLSGSSKGDYYEERVAIELFTLGLLREVERSLGEKIFCEEVFREITGYLTSALYRMKNNFVLKSEGDFAPVGDVGEIIYNVCRDDELLSERLRGEEITYIKNLIEDQLEQVGHRVIELEKLMDIIKGSAEKVDEGKLAHELLREYGRWIIPYKSEEMVKLEDLLLEEKVSGKSLEEVVEAGSGILAEKGVIRKRVDFSCYIKANAFKGRGLSCYYIGDENIVVKSGILMTPLRGGEENVIILALRDEITYLDALWKLKKIVDRGLAKNLVKR